MIIYRVILFAKRADVLVLVIIAKLIMIPHKTHGAKPSYARFLNLGVLDIQRSGGEWT